MATKVKVKPKPKSKTKSPTNKTKPTTTKPKPPTHKPKAPPLTAKAKSKPVVASTEPEPLPEGWNIPPADKGEYLERILTLGHRVETYVKFMKKIEGVPGTSAETRYKALTAFYERMLMFDRELGRIQEELQLG